MTLKQTTVLLSRIALFVIYFWFGFLKIIGMSPASTLVQDLFNHPIIHPFFAFTPFITPHVFVIVFGVFEVIIGILFIIPGKEKWASTLFYLHMFTTFLPLFLLKGLWQGFLAPTLEGQYIIKNLALIACALTVLQAGKEAQIKPLVV